MTDNDIIKALEFCASKGRFKCDGCPFSPRDERCRNRGVYALDLINRQKAEIERLNSCVKTEDEVRAIANATIQAGIEIIKAEVIKEIFAEIEKVATINIHTGEIKISVHEYTELKNKYTKENIK